MDIESLRTYCLARPGVTECFPFDEWTLVFKVAGKMFAFVPLERVPLSVNLKCDPERAVELRERYAAVTPGYYSNKKHWNTVLLDGEVPASEVRWMIDHSYELVVAALPRKVRATLETV